MRHGIAAYTNVLNSAAPNKFELIKQIHEDEQSAFVLTTSLETMYEIYFTKLLTASSTRPNLEATYYIDNAHLREWANRFPKQAIPLAEDVAELLLPKQEQFDNGIDKYVFPDIGERIPAICFAMEIDTSSDTVSICRLYMLGRISYMQRYDHVPATIEHVDYVYTATITVSLDDVSAGRICNTPAYVVDSVIPLKDIIDYLLSTNTSYLVDVGLGGNNNLIELDIDQFIQTLERYNVFTLGLFDPV
jgi:hypothetical protein